MSNVESTPNEASQFAITPKNRDNKEMKMDSGFLAPILQYNFGNVIHNHGKAIRE
jgi:hypothetical protein